MKTHVLSTEMPRDIEITSTQVFIAKNIVPYETTIDNHHIIGYEYDLYSYTKDEYLVELIHDNETLRDELEATKILLGVE